MATYVRISVSDLRLYRLMDARHVTLTFTSVTSAASEVPDMVFNVPRVPLVHLHLVLRLKMNCKFAMP
jgi:hypothetical protein